MGRKTFVFPFATYYLEGYMKLIDMYNGCKEQYPEAVVFIKSGKFYLTFDNDAFIIGYLLNYKKVNNKVGFPESAKEKVVMELNNKEINYFFIDEDGKQYDNNQYYLCLKKANEDIMVTNIANSLVKTIKEKITLDFDNYGKIKDFINEL